MNKFWVIFIAIALFNIYLYNMQDSSSRFIPPSRELDYSIRTNPSVFPFSTLIMHEDRAGIVTTQHLFNHGRNSVYFTLTLYELAEADNGVIWRPVFYNQQGLALNAARNRLLEYLMNVRSGE